MSDILRALLLDRESCQETPRRRILPANQ